MLAMSGGVDSSVALVLLKDKFEVLGVTMNLFDSNTGDEKSGACCSLTDAKDAGNVAGRFDIPHYVYNFKERFKNDVIDRFVRSYLSGETPNPCIDCNKYVKFGALMERARSLGCEYMATGHYARVKYDGETGRYLLKKASADGRANPKDQSYVLYSLTQEQLSRVVLPLGTLTKEQVREIARENNLINSKKPDSQDICFVPDGDYAEFIGRYAGIVPERGLITDKDGNVLGEHGGIIKYTVGQRKGLGISAKNPLYVIGKEAGTNRVIAGENTELFSGSLIAREFNWISIPELKSDIRVRAKTRYSQAEQPCVASPADGGNVRITFDVPQRAITPGQSVVLYDGDIVVGGGTIQRAIDNE